VHTRCRFRGERHHFKVFGLRSFEILHFDGLFGGRDSAEVLLGDLPLIVKLFNLGLHLQQFVLLLDVGLAFRLEMLLRLLQREPERLHLVCLLHGGLVFVL